MLLRTKCVSCNGEDTQTTPAEVELKCEIVYKGLLRQTDKECLVVFNAVIISSKYGKTLCDDNDELYDVKDHLISKGSSETVKSSYELSNFI